MIALVRKFENHLKLDLKKSAQTVRNYKADLKHFLSWLEGESKSPVSTQSHSFLLHFNSKNILLYRLAQVNVNTPSATTNRRLSSVRNFGKFAKSIGILEINPGEAIENIRLTEKNLGQIIQDFEQYLKESKISDLTIKNYLSDIRQFISWLEENAPVSPVVHQGQGAQPTEHKLQERAFRLEIVSE